MLTSLVCRLVILVFGTLYPAFSSYKAIRTKNIKGYVKWMMYWIVFALFISVETFTDLLLSWFPFYYEIKMLLVLWLLSPATRGSSLLYRKFVHPWLERNEAEIDQCIERARQQGYSTVMTLGSKGVTYATQVLVQTAMAGGSGLVGHIQRSYSVNDVTDLATPEREWRPLPCISDDEPDSRPHGRRRRSLEPPAVSSPDEQEEQGTARTRAARSPAAQRSASAACTTGGTLPRSTRRRTARRQPRQ